MAAVNKKVIGSILQNKQHLVAIKNSRLKAPRRCSDYMPPPYFAIA